MALTPEQTAEFQALQRRVMTGDYTRDELRRAVEIMRQDRVAAQISSTTSRTAKAAAKAPVDTSALLANLKAAKAKLESPSGGGYER